MSDTGAEPSLDPLLNQLVEASKTQQKTQLLGKHQSPSCRYLQFPKALLQSAERCTFLHMQRIALPTPTGNIHGNEKRTGRTRGPGRI